MYVGDSYGEHNGVRPNNGAFCRQHTRLAAITS